MAGFPQVIATAALPDFGDTTSRVYALPTDIQDGELLLVGLSMRGTGTMAITESGWTLLSDNHAIADFSGTASGRVSVAYKIADGTETEITVTTSAAVATAFVAARIGDHRATSAPELAGYTVLGSGTSPDPPASTPSWGVEDTLFVAFSFSQPGYGYEVGPPTGYENFTEAHVDSSWSVAAALATLEAHVTSENPGQFDHHDSATWASTVVAVRPAIPEAPILAVAPALSGAAQVGQTLTCSTGVFTGFPHPTFTYQWQRDTLGDGVYGAISGATASTWTLLTADLDCHVRCVVTATNTAGTASEPSNADGPVTMPPLAVNLRLSGGAANANPGVSIGGAKSSAHAGVDLFDNVYVRSGNYADYRLVYVHNDETEQDVSAVAFISDQLESGRELAIAVATQAAGVTVPAIANDRTAPAGVTFVTPTAIDAAVNLGTIPVGSARGLWIRRSVAGGTAADPTNPGEITLQVDRVLT